MPEFAPVINVSALNGANGFRLDGDATGDNSGHAVAGGGDVNGDGFDDVLVGAPYSDTDGANRGLAWVVFGAAASPVAQTLAARGSAGTAYRFQGEAAGDQAGFSVSIAGDVNGDGFDDLLIGANRAAPDASLGPGATYLVLGGAAHLEALDGLDGSNDNQVALANIVPAHGFRFDGVANGNDSGRSVSGAGDIDGDGFADLIIGAPFASTLGGNFNGATYVVFGGANLGDLDDDDGAADGRIDLAQISAGQGLRLDGARTAVDDDSGISVSAAGDVNGDGFADVILGARNADPNSGGANGNEGAAYIVFGQSRAVLSKFPSFDLANPDGLLATRLDGVAANDRAGFAVSGLGDIDGDGFDDVLVGARYADSNGTVDAGSAFVVFGKSGWGASLNLAALDGSDGFRLDGLRSGDDAGQAVSSAGDINGDGFQDLLIGARLSDRIGATNSGAAYVVFGKASGFAATVDLGSLDGNDGLRIDGAAGDDRLGQSVAATGDVNGDGFDDLIVGANRADNGGTNTGTNTGSSYIVYGHRAQSSVTRIGTEFDDRINGGIGADTISGLDGNDTLVGWEDDDHIQGGAGLDTISGGDGDDVIQGDGGNDVIDGGNDDDRLEGGSGADRFLASTGDDVILGGSGGDILDFAALNTAIAANLATGLASYANGLGSASFSSITTLSGDLAADNLVGDARANRLLGQAGNDTLKGADGNDTLTGGLGRDAMTGGTGADSFDFNLATETGTTAGTRDIVTDFAHLIDLIDLATIDAIAGGTNNAFSFIGTGAFTAAGQLHVVQSGADTIVEANTGGTLAADLSLQLSNVTATTLAAVDFVL